MATVSTASTDTTVTARNTDMVMVMAMGNKNNFLILFTSNSYKIPNHP